MARITRHRGPDDEGFYIGPGIQMGVRRLSIIDLKTGHQPISSEDRSVTAVCNGEIYNSIGLKHQLDKRSHRFRSRSDAEVIVHLYEEYGVECVERLRGMFAFALWDAKKRQLMLARDRLGIKPLYYAIAHNGNLYFGSEIKTILVADGVERKIDSQAFKDLFTFGFILSPKTLFATIKRLLPGQYLLYRNGEFTLRQYWHLAFPERATPRPALSVEDWAEAIRAKIEQSVSIHLRSDVPVGAWLSGGIDSSAIVSLMAGFESRPVQTFSLVFESNGRSDEITKGTLADFPEYPIVSHKVAFKNEHFTLLPRWLWHHEEPSSSAVGLCQLVLSEATSRAFKVVLTGEGSDEIFGGYHWYHVDKLFRPFAGLPVWARRILLLGSLIPKWKPFASQAFLAPRQMGLPRYAQLLGMLHPEIVNEVFSEEMRSVLEASSEPSEEFLMADERHKWHAFSQLQHVDITTRLCSFITAGLDRATMAHSVEARVPYLDHELVELCAHIPASLKMRWLNEKYILRHAMKKHLPAVILAKKKRGLAAPAHRWLRGALPEFAVKMLSDRSLREKGYFNPLLVQRILTSHRNGKADYSRILMVILTTQIWDELFMRRRWPPTASETQAPLDSTGAL